MQKRAQFPHDLGTLLTECHRECVVAQQSEECSGNATVFASEYFRARLDQNRPKRYLQKRLFASRPEERGGKRLIGGLLVVGLNSGRPIERAEEVSTGASVLIRRWAAALLCS